MVSPDSTAACCCGEDSNGMQPDVITWNTWLGVASGGSTCDDGEVKEGVDLGECNTFMAWTR